MSLLVVLGPVHQSHRTLSFDDLVTFYLPPTLSLSICVVCLVLLLNSTMIFKLYSKVYRHGFKVTKLIKIDWMRS